MPQPNVIQLLESLLEEAKSGELVSVAIAKMYRDNHTQSAWATGYDTLPVLLMGAISVLAADYAERVKTYRDEPENAS